CSAVPADDTTLPPYDDHPAPPDLLVAALYRFADLGRGRGTHELLRQPILAFMREQHVRGTLLLSQEGINGTVAGSDSGVGALVEFLKDDPIFDGLLADLQPSFSRVATQPFKRTKVRLKREIVTMGVDGIDPTQHAGTYVEPQDWNALIDRDDVLLVDTRNRYEYDVGTFRAADGRAASDPQTSSFREFPAYVDAALDPARHKKVAMFCTGGIRCEKATAYLKQQGFEDVFHLRGGILEYLETIPEAESRWQGECFVFDDRVAVGHDLGVGSHVLCYGCRFPVSRSQQSDPRYQFGVSCPRCHAALSEDRRHRLEERHRQVEIAEARGEEHLGDRATEFENEL
ncbi:MAG: oxygen-dependent tRNA uridine(34) hydroxylase TrhO, partial [Planctomycetota bacterium]